LRRTVWLDFDESKDHSPEPQHIAIVEVSDGHLAAIDERAVAAAIVEHASAVAALGGDRVASRDVRIPEPHGGPEAAADVGNRGVERYQPGSVAVARLEVSPRRRVASRDAAGARSVVENGQGVWVDAMLGVLASRAAFG